MNPKRCISNTPATQEAIPAAYKTNLFDNLDVCVELFFNKLSYMYPVTNAAAINPAI